MGTYINLYEKDKKKYKNTGFKRQALESKLRIPVLSNGFAFASVADFENRDKFREAIGAKSLVPLFEVHELADASTEDKKFESGSFSKVIENGVEKITFECYISIPAFNALQSYEESEYNELFEYNQDGDYSGVYDTDGVKVRGRKITSINVTRLRATKEKVPYVKGEIVFDSKTDVERAVVTKSNLTKEDLEGIFDVELKQIHASATSIVFKAYSEGALVKDLDTKKIFLNNTSGKNLRPNGITFEPSNGTYEIKGTGFASGFTVGMLGVDIKPNIMFEVVDLLKIEVATN
ncbi:conserved hypothetical protein [Tenacibaculum litopenaei]|uniref:hypothetical protein n=1 Tax=Tenacibaculum litopenaei TaxID=396016 RepID=UPI0038957ED9